jgi:hypothetical protein
MSSAEGKDFLASIRFRLRGFKLDTRSSKVAGRAEVYMYIYNE